MNKRNFYSLGLSPDGQIGCAGELERHEIPGYTPQAVADAHARGEPFTGFSSLRLCEAERLGRLPDGIKLLIKPRADYSDFDVVVNGIGWIIISNRLGDAIAQSSGQNTELLPVPLLNTDGTLVRSDFRVLNVLRVVDALSEKKTIRSRDGKSVLRMGITESKVPSDAHIFRVLGWQWPIIIDNVLKQKLERIPHDGLIFLPREQD